MQNQYQPIDINPGSTQMDDGSSESYRLLTFRDARSGSIITVRVQCDINALDDAVEWVAASLG